MTKKFVTTLVLLTCPAVDIFAGDIEQHQREHLYLSAKDRLAECSETFSERRLDNKSVADAFASLFSRSFPIPCVEMTVDWYRKQATEIASNEGRVTDRDFRSNRDALLIDVDRFAAEYGQNKIAHTTTVVPLFSTVTAKSQESRDKRELDALRGYTNLGAEQ
jgi:hypothetical protein